MAMLSKEDLKQIAGKGMTEAQVNAQLEQFKTGFPYLRLEAAQVSAVRCRFCLMAYGLADYLLSVQKAMYIFADNNRFE